jgi:hypothetical protein
MSLPCFVHRDDNASQRYIQLELTTVLFWSSNEVLAVIADDLSVIGFDVESEKGKIKRPVFYGENGSPTKAYNIDAFHDGWKCALEIEMARAIGGNAVYRDLIQALVSRP